MTSDTNDSSVLTHRHTWDAIPWIVNGTASPADRAMADEHLRTCADCRDDLAFQSLVHAGMNVTTAAMHDGKPALDRLFARIDAESKNERNFATDTLSNETSYANNPLHDWHAPSRHKWTRYRARLLAAIVAAQTVGLVLLGVLLLRQEHQPNSSARYETLSEASIPAGPATIRFVPVPSLTVGAMQAMLADAKLRIVESNQGSSIYGLAPEPNAQSGLAEDASMARAASTTMAVARLRNQPGVLLVEPIVSPSVAPR
ncbi:zf-HC2 domain-containing protein [Pseudolysobacter antarcticus]|uniref:Zf-HC2 domain-containing protein n=1 Tax=Pseudolysobacter antarcticus TaxID=2511995 RepID=A0A411HIE2_9GAMM|nr:zf-HC2 domain-containing protein [Pseudolysobacter antarcticus]QBB70275.1 zf-HC2 domain-containing protein [Pseudolysobacter antarcticus]